MLSNNHNLGYVVSQRCATILGSIANIPCFLLAYIIFSINSASASSMMGLRLGGAFMHNYNPVWGGELGFFHTGPLNFCTYNSPYGYKVRLGLYFDRYFNILDGTTFPSPLYRRYLIPLNYSGYVSLRGLLEYYGVINHKPKMVLHKTPYKEMQEAPHIDFQVGFGPVAYWQMVKALPKNLQKENLIPMEHPVLRGVDYTLFLGLNAHTELQIVLTKLLSLSVQSQVDIFLTPIPLGDFPNRAIFPELPKLRATGAMNLNMRSGRSLASKTSSL